MICKKCGKENEKNAKYCTNCGAELKKKNKTGIGIVPFIVILAISVVVICGKKYFFDNGNKSYSSTADAGNTYSGDKNSEETYQMNESFSIGDLELSFTKVFANEEYDFWQASAEGSILAGFEGVVRNNSGSSIDLNDLSYFLYFIDGNGKNQQTSSPRVEFYAPSGLGDSFSTSSIIEAGQEGTIYIFACPDENCKALYLNISDPKISRQITVENNEDFKGSYESEDRSSFIRMAKGYSEDLACVQFYSNEHEYYGYMDKDANMKFYFSSKYEDDFCDPPTDFENGYAHYEYGHTMYVFNKDGQVVSKYDDASDCVAYGSGYTWMETDISGYDETGSEYTLYGPDGTVEAEPDTGENDFLKSPYEVTIEYMGSGIFLYQYWNDDDEEVRKYYFTQSHKWVTVDVFNDVEDTQVLNGWLYNCVYYTDGDREKYMDLYDKNGENCEVPVPEELYDSAVWVCDVSEKYILFESRYEDENYFDDIEKTFWVYNKETKEFKSYNGKYMDRIDDDGYANKLFQDSIVISLDGEDGNDYIGFINIADMTELGEPVLARSVEVYEDVTVVNPDTSSDVQQILYDSRGNTIYTYMESDYTGWLGGFKDNIMVAGCGYDYNDGEPGTVIHKYMDYSGTVLFDKINYASGSEMALSIETVE